ncbi:P-loop_NTPase super family protein [Catovirus CTV1]|uniref:p-loop_NTPase super family protein n=1 Tax=Catovirus CTV1 TaxID=1977631 RepID=A0A1V0S9N3_9VIRU|nr:P-loop_NTPase super family protein [Catovirus CTV1]
MIESITNHIRFAVVGESKSGKSTFINSLIGRELLPKDINNCTNGQIYVTHIDNDKSLIIESDNIYEYNDDDELCKKLEELKINNKKLELRTRWEKLTNKHIQLVDTQGIDDNFSLENHEICIKSTVCTIYFVDYSAFKSRIDEPNSQQETKIINDIVKVLRWQKNSIIIISQYDVIFNKYKNSKKNKKNILDLNTINDECRKEIKKNIKKRIGNNFDENKIFFSSCEYSDDIKEVMDKCNEEILNKIELIAQEKSYPILSKNIIKASTNFAHLILYSFTGLAQNNSAIIPSNFKKDYKKELNKRKTESVVKYIMANFVTFNDNLTNSFNFVEKLFGDYAYIYKNDAPIKIENINSVKKKYTEDFKKYFWEYILNVEKECKFSQLMYDKTPLDVLVSYIDSKSVRENDELIYEYHIDDIKIKVKTKKHIKCLPYPYRDTQIYVNDKLYCECFVNEECNIDFNNPTKFYCLRNSGDNKIYDNNISEESNNKEPFIKPKTFEGFFMIPFSKQNEKFSCDIRWTGKIEI